MAGQPRRVSFPVDLARKLAQYAKRLKRCQSWIEDEAVRSRIERESKRHRLTQQALNSAEAGRLIDHQQVEEWLDSFGSSEPKPVPAVEGSLDSSTGAEP